MSFKKCTATLLVFFVLFTLFSMVSFADCENLAVGAKTTYSGESGENLVDGELSTAWMPSKSANGDWIELTFDNPITFNTARIFEYREWHMFDYKVEKFKIQYSNNGKKWIDAYEDYRIGREKKVCFPTVTTKYVRFIVKIRTPKDVSGINELILSYNPEIELGRKTYYVATDGDDNNEGTLEKPFKTIQHSADIMKAGDTCNIRGGVYNETVTPKNNGTTERPIKYQAYQGEIVTISGCTSLDKKWEKYKENIYKTSYDKSTTQLFMENKLMTVARWPNADVNNYLSKDYAVTTAGDYGYIKDSKLPEGDWQGATIHIWPGSGWDGYDKEIGEYSPGEQLNFKEPFTPKNNGFDSGDPYRPKDNNNYFIYGALAGLDIATEWVQDKSTNDIYFWAPDNVDPNNLNIQVKQRNYAFDIRDKSNIEITGLDMIGASLNVLYSNNIIIDSCNITYPTDTSTKSNILDGEDNVIKNSYIAYCISDGIMLQGERIVAENNIVHDVNLWGSKFSAISTQGNDIWVQYNTLYRAGRALVQHYNTQRIRILHNELYEGSILSPDTGATYTWGIDAQGGEIAYNVIHDMHNELAAGIYLDNFSLNFTIHHNLIYNTYNGIVLNSDSINNCVYNNTMVNIEARTFTTFAYAGYTLNQRGCKIYNNIINNNNVFVTGENGAELKNNMLATVGADFRPAQGSALIDGGVSVVGINDIYKGKAPDVGCFEDGMPKWEYGATLEVAQRYNFD